MTFRKLLAALLASSLLPYSAFPMALHAQQTSSPSAAAKTGRPKVTITQAPPETPEQFAARKLALQEMLQRLTTTGRIMQVVAHPDDEDGAMLTLESRVKGNTAELFTFTRGEGGQNAQGAVFFDELGILRTLELLAADKEYGAEERFSHVADFGFSKTADETYAKWGGRDVPLADLVRAVREFQPDVLVARFSGTPRDGHGHHQASAQMTVQAFTDAANPKRFPGEGTPWQPSKLYTGLAGDQATLVPDETQPSALLGGKTPQEVAIAGLRHQESQGAGNWKGPIPKIYSSYKLVGTASGVAKTDHETDFFGGVDTSLPALVDRFPVEASQSPGLKQILIGVSYAIHQAADALQQGGPPATIPYLEAAATGLAARRGPSCLDNCPRGLQSRLFEKYEEIEEALRLADGISATLTPMQPISQAAFVSPGDQVRFQFMILNQGTQAIELQPAAPNVELHQITSALQKLPASLGPGKAARVEFTFNVAETAELTRATFHRDSPVRDSVYQLRDPFVFSHAALTPPPIQTDVPWEIGHVTCRTVVVARTEKSPVFIAPRISVSTTPTALLRLVDQPSSAVVQVDAHNNTRQTAQGLVSISTPKGWSGSPAQTNALLSGESSSSSNFLIRWPTTQGAMQSTLQATLTSAGKTYSESYHLISRPDLPDAFPYYAPAQTTISLIDADIPAQHSIGYIMGAGDTIPDDLTSLGFTVHLLTPDDLATADLSKYDTIVTGVRAYATRADLREHNQRLLDFVKNGGTMVVQYEQDTDGFNKGNYAPFPLSMGKDRVSQEEQPVTMLDAESQIFRYPNRITSADFDNWVQERGLYFMKQWSADYTPLLRMNDAGEPPLDGALLVAHYGKGTYITTALSFYRELPNGVPGATRLFINLLAAGHNPAEQPVVSATR